MTAGSYSSESCKANTIIKHLNKSFQLGIQQDAHEVLLYLLDSLSSLESKRLQHQDTGSLPEHLEKKISKKKMNSPFNTIATTNLRVIKYTSKASKMKNKSLSKVNSDSPFHGRMASTVCCNTCLSESTSLQ